MTEELVDKVTINGETVKLKNAMSESQAKNYLESMGFGDHVNGMDSNVQEGVMTFQQLNGEKGSL